MHCIGPQCQFSGTTAGDPQCHSHRVYTVIKLYIGTVLMNEGWAATTIKFWSPHHQNMKSCSSFLVRKGCSTGTEQSVHTSQPWVNRWSQINSRPVFWHQVAGKLPSCYWILLMKDRAEGNAVLLALGPLSFTEAWSWLVIFSYVHIPHITWISM